MNLGKKWVSGDGEDSAGLQAHEAIGGSAVLGKRVTRAWLSTSCARMHEAMNLASGGSAEVELLLPGSERCVADNNDTGEGQCGWLEPTASAFTNRQANNTLGRPVLGLEIVAQRSQGLPLNEAM